ncbi:MAG TPA: SGNH/GDSL hydrolase family protein [Candidatus Lokiarchaeia archaeon]|nr:SGNH/GDSL hydrolase family protein [Candidatus Lokiarchaeia archaeon]
MDYDIEGLKDFIHGFYWFGGENLELTRFPRSSFSTLSKGVADLSTHMAGGRIEFRAQTDGIGFEANVVPASVYDCFSRAGQYGCDVYIDGKYYHTFTPPRDGYFLSWMKTDGSIEHEYKIYLPTYSAMKIISLGVDDEIAPSEPHAIQKPIVFYGSSITQGAYASRPGLAFPSIIGRALDAEIINLGFSGNGKGEPEVADLVAQIDASCFVMDWGGNLTVLEEDGLFEQRYRPFLQKIKDRHPETPILCNSLQWINPLEADPGFQERCARIRAETKAAYDEEVASGNKKIAFIDGTTIIGPNDKELTADGTHANDAGFLKYAQVMVPVLKKLLGVK